LGIVGLIGLVRIGDVGLNSRVIRFAGPTVYKLWRLLTSQVYASSYESRINRGKGEEEEGNAKREERGHTVASETFFPLRINPRLD